MDFAQIMVTAGGMLLILFVLWFFFGKGEGRTAREEGAYQCPMHPWVSSNDPTGNCSSCGMKLVKS